MIALPIHRFRLPPALLASLFSIVLLLVGTGSAAADSSIYVMIAGIKGEVLKTGYNGALEALSVSYGASAPVSIGPSGTTVNKPSFSDISMAHIVAASSPVLFQYLTTNKVISSMTIDFVKSIDDGGKTYMRIALTNAYVTSQGAGASGDAPVESLSFAYQKITIIYYAADGTTPVSTGSYDLTKGS